MGLTPLEGLVMGERTGDIDPAAVFHLARVAKMSIDEIDRLFNRESGMKGLAGDNDMREVWKRIDAGEREARDAMDIYLHRLVKYVGAYTKTKLQISCIVSMLIILLLTFIFARALG